MKSPTCAVSEFIAFSLHSLANPRGRRGLRGALLLGGCSLLLATVRADYRDDIGYTKLQLELGATLPTGSGVGVAQTEAPSGTAFLPNTTVAEFSGKTFTVLSPGGGVSGHATTVGQYFYGSATSIAPGVTGIHNYEANDWVGSGFLNYGSTSAPKTETQKIENNSWVTSAASSADAEILRRFDFAIQRDNFLAVSGLNNGSGTTIPTLMASSYNGLVVGLTSGAHSSGQTATEGSGRLKPDIVCQTPENATSFATPVIGGAGALLAQKALSVTSLNSAANSVALKSLLMAGATKSQIPSWSRPINGTQPMDLHYGAGQLNIFNSYHILVAGNQPASNSVSVKSRGWNFTSTAPTARIYFFDIAAGDTSPNFSAVLTWNRVVANTLPGPLWGSPSSSLPNLFLKLFTASGFTPGTLVDSSVSTIDNVQLLYQPNLAPGRYALEVSSATTGISYGLAWYSLPTVTIAATTPDASEQGPVAGQFTVTRAGDTTDPLTVNYAISGTAGNTADYSTIANSITIPAGASAAAITITPIPDAVAEGDETAVLTLSGDPAYTVGAAASATVTIHDKPIDAWRFSKFTAAELADPLQSGDLADFEKDGIPNLHEYAFGLEPKTPDTGGLPAVFIQPGGALAITYTHVKSAVDITYTVEVSNDLATWHSGASFTALLGTVDHGATETLKYGSLLPTDPSKRQFMRVRITRT